MTHTYKVLGMTCNNCKAAVQKHLSELDNVTKVDVDLEKGEVEVSMTKQVSTETLKNTLPEKYQLSEKKVENKSAPIETFGFEEKSKWQQLKPLFFDFALPIGGNCSLAS